MSHHLDSPASRRDSRLNVTDLYVFDGDSGTVFAMVTNTSLAGDARTPGFHPEGRYEFRIHPALVPVEQVVYRFCFGAPDPAGTQRYTVHRIVGEDAANDSATGQQVAEGTTGTPTEAPGLRAWAGESADPFYLDLGHLGHLLDGLQNHHEIDLGDWTPGQAKSTFTGSRVNTIVLEVPTSDEVLTDGRHVGVWAATKLATDAGGWHQTNRTAIPMMWPIFHALGGDDGSPEYLRDTVGQPADDRDTIGPRIAEIVAAAAAPSGVADPEVYGRKVAEQLTPDLLPYRIGSPAGFTFAEFNGRALSDNAPEVMYGLVTNSARETGLKAVDAAETRQDKFPYIVPSA
ncbi:DUF4331 family protein [Nocardioides sp. CER19]|uniref:DUF4331 family protein n=1 Tax=Nocardioides sp. CER19 TaxID=3038538 RepID=UPI00244CB551|nr:DUF4331 family protein [Nocardioides sp. CER19]MDH2413840.1 DUF4331 family protein [Nocardioides sp. CER19]